MPLEGTYLAWLDCRATPIADQPAQFFLDQARVGLNEGTRFGPLVFTDPFGKPLEKPEKENIGLGTAWYFGRLILDANPDQGFMYEK